MLEKCNSKVISIYELSRNRFLSGESLRFPTKCTNTRMC